MPKNPQNKIDKYLLKTTGKHVKNCLIKQKKLCSTYNHDNSSN